MSAEKQEIKPFYSTDIFFLGFTLIGAQIILLREFLLIFNGNELIVGLLFSVWMIITAFGSWLGRFFFSKQKYPGLIRLLLVVIAVFPLIAAFSVGYFRNIVFEYGRMISLLEALIYSFIILFPVCCSGGLLFTLLNHSAEGDSRKFKNLYAIESIGSLVGGLLISLFFIYKLEVNNFRSLTYLLLINFVYFGISDFNRDKHFRSFVFLILAIGIMFFIYNIDLEKKAKEMIFFGQELVFTKETPYGNLSVTKMENQTNIYKDGIVYYSSDNLIRREEDVHFAMLQKPNANTILLIGGGISGTIQELLKYPSVKEITYLEMDPIFFSLNVDGLSGKPGVDINKYAIDPVIFLQNTTQSYDVVLINQPPPSNVQINRFYTVNFFEKLKRSVAQDGVISTRLPSSNNYLSDEEVVLQATIYNSIKEVFNHIIVVPAGQTYFIASDDTLNIDYVPILSRLNLGNKYVNNNYLNDDLMQFRSGQILASYSGIESMNYNFKPIAYISYIQHWLNYYRYKYRLILIMVLLVVVIFIILMKPASQAIFTSGFAGVGVEIVLIIVFQVLLGYMYLFIGVLITIFMAGLAIGSYLSKKSSPEKAENQTIVLQLLSGIFIVGLSGIFLLLEQNTKPWFIQTSIIINMLIISILVGLQYGISVSGTKTNPNKTVSNIYSAELVGSAFGSLVIVIFLIPVFGIHLSLYCLAGLHFLTILVIYLKRKIKYL